MKISHNKGKLIDLGKTEIKRKQWQVPTRICLHSNNTSGKANPSVGEGVVGTTNFCKINASSNLCLTFGPS
jgi:hypothetical protein